MDYKIISFDDHLDLSYLPADFWTRRMSGGLARRAPHVEIHRGDSVWVCDGKVWGTWRGRMSETESAAPVPPTPTVTALEAGGEVDLRQRRPAIPALRLEDMDRDGVWAHVIYGPIFSIVADDPVLRDACHRVYNDSLGDLCAQAPDRLFGVPMLPPSPEAAITELTRLAKSGAWRQANLQIAEVEPRLHDGAWEPFWSLLEETGMILSFHVAVTGLPKTDPAFGKPQSAFALAKLFPNQFLDPFIDLFAWGILERHPKMRVVLAEAGLGWLPWLVQELDHRFELLYRAKRYWDERGGIDVKVRPSVLFKQQIYASFQDDPVAMSLLEFMGEDNVLWASDYPHPDSTWPHSRAKIEAQMGHLSPSVQKKLLHDNAVKLYGLALSNAPA